MIFSRHPMAIKTRRYVRYFAYSILLTSLALLIAVPIWAISALGELSDSSDRSFDDPKTEFQRLTGFELPASTKFLAAGDSHNGLSNEGECFFIIETDPQVVEQWLKSNPPWGETWSPTPIPESVSWDKFAFHNHDYKDYAQDATSPDAFYCSEDFAKSEIPWHNGRLLSVNPKSGRVYLSWWDR